MLVGIVMHMKIIWASYRKALVGTGWAVFIVAQTPQKSLRWLFRGFVVGTIGRAVARIFMRGYMNVYTFISLRD